MLSGIFITSQKMDWSPTTFLCDFEDALRNSLAEVFPHALIYGDAFHVIQDNLRWFRHHGLHEYNKELVTTL